MTLNRCALSTLLLAGLATGCRRDNPAAPPRVLTTAEQQLAGSWHATQRLRMVNQPGRGLVRDSTAFVTNPPVLSCQADGTYADAPGDYLATGPPSGQFICAPPTLELHFTQQVYNGSVLVDSPVIYYYQVLQQPSQGFVLRSLGSDPSQFEQFTYTR